MMRTIINYIVGAGILLLLSMAARSQNGSLVKTDRLIFLNGTMKEGKVTGMVSSKIQFVHTSETVSYEFDKKEIEKIEYASGRNEWINERRSPVVHVSARNRVAVLPMSYIGDGNDERMYEMRFQLQEIAIRYMSKSAMALNFLDAAEINAILFREGIDAENIRQFTPAELGNILHVEYLVMGSVLQDMGSLVTVTTNHNTHRQIVNRYDRRGRPVITRRNNNVGSQVTRQHIKTQVSLSIYNETGQNIYTSSRRSILSENDAYRAAIQYLLKRTPLYQR